MRRSKKGLSPLIAAVLLIVVVVSIGAIVTGIVRGMISENKQTVSSKSGEISCSRDVMVTILQIDDQPQICVESGYVYAILENTGSKAVDDFQLVVMGSTGVFRNESISASDRFTIGEAQEFNASYSSVGNLEQVKLVPKIKKAGSSGYHFCSDVAVVYSGLTGCDEI
ncbi:hypothetical protein HQ545_07895 [Candidatus Woesearchaeota archaeon]|nr:hypothetical protein [Candidatus Woesearchaeota archaeon]